MLRNSLKQMLVEGAAFETRHGKPCLGIAVLLCVSSLPRIKSGGGLTGIQRRKLLGVSEEKFDLETRFVPTKKRLRIQVGIGAEQHRPPLGAGIHDEHDAQSLPRTSIRGTFVTGTVAAEITKRGVARQHQHKPQQMGDELSLRFLGLGQRRQYTLKGTSKNASWMIKDDRIGHSHRFGGKMNSAFRGISSPGNGDLPVKEDIRHTPRTAYAQPTIPRRCNPTRRRML